jgi:hypothetical protein
MNAMTTPMPSTVAIPEISITARTRAKSCACVRHYGLLASCSTKPLRAAPRNDGRVYRNAPTNARAVESRLAEVKLDLTNRLARPGAFTTALTPDDQTHLLMQRHIWRRCNGDRKVRSVVAARNGARAQYKRRNLRNPDSKYRDDNAAAIRHKGYVRANSIRTITNLKQAQLIHQYDVHCHKISSVADFADPDSHSASWGDS